jgi:hypothetical protein
MAEKSESPSEGHPEIDWSKWEPAGEGDGTLLTQFQSPFNPSLYFESN